jgi:hypothetical protein
VWRARVGSRAADRRCGGPPGRQVAEQPLLLFPRLFPAARPVRAPPSPPEAGGPRPRRAPRITPHHFAPAFDQSERGASTAPLSQAKHGGGGGARGDRRGEGLASRFREVRDKAAAKAPPPLVLSGHAVSLTPY